MHSYLSRMKGAQAFISMDPNLLRIPEVVLERIEIKIEDDAPIKAEKSERKEASVLGDPQVKCEKEWRTEKRDPPEESAAAPCCSLADTEAVAVYQGAENSKEYNPETAPAKSAGNEESGRPTTSRTGCNGLPRKIGRTPGRRKRGGWRQYVSRDRQQCDQKMMIQSAAYVEEERQRGQRFSEEENQVLVESVLAHYKELCGYSTLKGSATRKKRLWQEVVNKVNTIGAAYRTIEVCKKRYGDCKRTVKVKMAALEHQSMGGRGPPEQIRFNSWEESLRQKIISTTMNAAQRVLDTCKPSSLELSDSIAKSTPQQCSSWVPIIDTSASQMIQAPMCDPVSDYDEASSPADIHLIGEWSEEEAPCTPAAPDGMNGAEHEPEYKLPAPLDMTDCPESSIADQHYQQLQGEHARSLHHLKQVHNAELHKLRENMVEGNARVVQQLEGLASEVRELNSHVQQIHMNQTHFNHMFQNYMSDTKQFYGAIVQAIKALQPAPTVSPMASPALSPKQPAAQTNPSQILETPAMFDSTSLSPAGSAEPASASSTSSEVNPSSQRWKVAPALQAQPWKKH
ncbi:uncharacterized protein ACNLHF_022573 [Anomaloglossus baeobatrachus]|uniref:uncharacterized protein LOC142243642 n=1 Tax=Anomaloglossus baeobatrachus TaxID=238106 RepID=UPI003F4F952B